MQKHEVVERVSKSELLEQIHKDETFVFNRIVTLALSQSENVHRWWAYEYLKRMAQQIVGWDARNQTLSTCQHYEAMIDLIDWMLPEIGGNEDPVGFEDQQEEEEPSAPQRVKLYVVKPTPEELA